MTTIPLKLLQKVSDIHNLGEIKSARFAPMGKINYNFLVKTSKGDFVFKKLGYAIEGWFAKQKPFQFEVMEYVNKNFPYKTPELLRKNGEYIIAVDGTLFEVYPKIKGKSLKKLNVAQTKEAAKALALFHKTIKKFPGKPHELDDLGASIDNYGDLRAVKPANTIDRYMCKHLDFFEGLFKDAAKIDRNINVLVNQGDFRSGNLLFVGNKLTGVIDFENVQWAPRIWDFVLDITDDPKQRNIFTNEYKKHASLSQKEIDMIVPLKLLKMSEIFPWIYKGENTRRKNKIEQLQGLVKRAKKQVEKCA